MIKETKRLIAINAFTLKTYCNAFIAKKFLFLQCFRCLEPLLLALQFIPLSSANQGEHNDTSIMSVGHTRGEVVLSVAT